MFTPLPDKIFRHAAARPFDVALLHDPDLVTYAEFDQWCSRLCRQLQEAGAGPGKVVGIYMKPSVEMAVSVLSVLRSGAAYVPLSTAFPGDRIRYILSDSGAAFLLYDEGAEISFIPEGTMPFMPDWQAVRNSLNGNQHRPVEISPNDLAYILYTSGSTGNPKGVMIEHRNLDYYVNWFYTCVMPESGAVLPLTSSFIFAAAVTQFYSTLLAGRTLHIVDPMLIRQPSALMGLFKNHPELGIYCVPTLWSEILRFLWSADGMAPDIRPPSMICLSGEAVSDEIIESTYARIPDARLWNLYGPTEATANITAGRLYKGERSHIGKPLKGTKIAIVNESLEPVKKGDQGELIACGEGIARGYINLPELTASAFFSRQEEGEAPERYYRSGDLVREEENGSLTYLGRKDQQVKIRGFRIELPEIEHAFCMPGIRYSAVKAVGTGDGTLRLVAYLTFMPDQSMPVDEIRKILSVSLPDYMIPEVFVILDQFPLLPNGKIDRKSLPAPGNRRPQLGYPAIPPVSAEEREMVRAWEVVLGFEGIGMEDNFFDLGGNSLKANALVMEIRARTGVYVPVGEVFGHQTPASLLAAMKKPGAGNTAGRAAFTSGREPSPRTGKELSENQKALWFLHQTEENLAAYNIFYGISFSGPLDPERLERALEMVLEKQPALRTGFRTGTDTVAEKILHNSQNAMKICHPEDGGSCFSQESALELARLEAEKPFKLEKDRLFRFNLYRTGPESHYLSFIVHHIVFDGLSFGLFMKDLQAFYAQTGKGINPPVIHPPANANEFADEESKYLASPLYNEDLAYWKRRLAEVPAFFELPTDFIRPETFTQKGGQVRVKVPSDLGEKLKTLSDNSGSSLFMTFLGAFGLLLFRQTGRRDFIIGTPVANRLRKEFLEATGYFVNTMLFRSRPEPSMTFADWLLAVREQVLESLEHSRFPLSHIGVAMKADRIPGVNTFFQVMFAFHESDWGFEDTSGLRIKAKEEFSGLSKFDLYTEVFRGNEETELVFTYSARLYSRETIEFLAGHFLEILRGISLNPGVQLAEAGMMSQEEYRIVVHEWNKTAGDVPEAITLPEMIFRQAAMTPTLTALAGRDRTFTYSQLMAGASAVARALKSSGLRKGDNIGLHMENSPEMVICITGILAAGMVYIPMDPYYPEERLRYVIERTETRCIITDQGKDGLKEHFKGQLTTPAELLAEAEGIEPFRCKAEVEDLAYIMFTSGSTGNPKGVMIRHDSLMNFLTWMKGELNASPSDTFLSSTSINFDISFLELFTPLISGSRLVLERRSDLQAPEKVEEILNLMQVNTVQFVPSGLKALCDAGVFGRAKYLKTIISGGEKLSRTLQEQLFAQSQAELINLYGPTEATVYMAFWRCRRENNLRMVPIGRPITNAAMYILDDRRRPVPVGVAGEAYLAGDVLAAGYFKDEEQTAARFMPDPFSSRPGARMYRVGDLCRFLADGAIEFLGRTDHQVKVRGFRIELGEVESVILRFPGIRRVVVDAHEQGEDDVRLTAFLVPSSPGSVNENQLKEFLKLHLPSYMIPGHFVTAPAIPTLPNGKTDRKALMKLRPAALFPQGFNPGGENETEKQIRTIWRELLGHEAFGSNDSFFEVGGHSLLLVRMKDMILSSIQTDVSIVDLFRFPTIRGLAAFLRKEKPAHDHADIVRRVAMRNKNIREQLGKRMFPGNKPN